MSESVVELMSRDQCLIVSWNQCQGVSVRISWWECRPLSIFGLSPTIRSVATETSRTDQSNSLSCDFVGQLHWFPVETDRTVELSPEVDRSLRGSDV